ncbi:MAG: hypothetical protein R8K49_09630 [Mariprofundaceae bacterium]
MLNTSAPIKITSQKPAQFNCSRRLEACVISQASAWSFDQQLWQLWVSLKFCMLGVTQQKKLRKADLRRLAKLFPMHGVERLEHLIQNMLASGLLRLHQQRVVSVDIDWLHWRKKQKNNILTELKQWEPWSYQEEQQALALLAELPVDCWLNLKSVETWLDTQTTGKLVAAAWRKLFRHSHSFALHHLSQDKQDVYFLPQFHDVITSSPVSFPAPGWYGAYQNAKASGFISASGEIQLLPDTSHKFLDQLVDFCSLSSLDHIITLQVNETALQTLASNPLDLKAARKALELLQSPLPQAVAYLFDQPRIKPAESSSEMTGQEAQDTSKQWLTGRLNIKSWMRVEDSRRGLWLEVSYQKSVSSKPKQAYAVIFEDYRGFIEVRCAKLLKGCYGLLSGRLVLEPKHILRVRELNGAEVKLFGLNNLA